MISSASSIVLRSRSSLLARTAWRSSSTLSSTATLLARPNNSRIPSATTPLRPAFFSSDSHDDFAPQKKKSVEGEDEALKMIQDHVENNRVMLYMKGNPSMPMCGFSARVVEVLQKEGVDFSSVNVLDYPAIREGVKKYAYVLS